MAQNINLKEKKIKVAIFGGGYDSTIAKVHLRSILATNKFDIKCGVFSRKIEKNFKNSKFWNVPINKVYNNIDKLLANESNNFDIAIILTPPFSRMEIYKKIISKNKYIISEKPIEGNFNELKNNLNKLKKLNNSFCCTYNYLGYPSIMEIKNLIKKIGSINNFLIEMPQQSSFLNTSIMKKWRTTDEVIPNLYLDLGSHIISLLNYFFGKFPNSVQAIEQINLKKNYVDNVFAWFDYKEFLGSCWFSKNALGNKNKISIRIFGSKGSIRWCHENPEEIYFSDSNGNTKILNRTSGNLKYLTNNKFYTYSAGHPFGFLDGFINIYEEIYSLFYKKNKSELLLSVKENINILNVLNQMHLSSKTNKWQKIKPVK
jgi:predicted dehydrogenase